MISIPVTANHTPHFATMPRGLADWLLSMSLPAKGICLDPFMGVGTSGQSAITKGGRFIGIDLEAEFLSHFRRQISQSERDSKEKVIKLRA
jgi:DNA modification methylase